MTLRDSDNLVLGFVSDIGQYTILEIVEKLKRVLRKDMKVDEYLSELLNKYKLRYDHKRDGRLGKVKMDTIFRKG